MSSKEQILRSAEERFEGLYREFRDPLMAYAMRRVSPDAAQDVVAETFAIVWRRLDSVPSSEPAGWLFVTARNVVIARWRREQRQERITERLENELEGNREVPDEAMATTPRPVLVALAELAESDREVLLLSAWEQLSSREGAAVLGCSPTAFRIRLHRARRRLSQELAGMDAAPEAGPVPQRNLNLNHESRRFSDG